MRKSAGLACLLLLAAGTGAFAAEPPAIPELADPNRYKDVPEPWHDYLLQARVAERIADPLQRCLAFPDIPGNHWPAGHAAAHCRYHFAHKPPSLREIAAMLDNGKIAELEALAEASQQRHLAEQDFSEDIHEFFTSRLFVASPEADRVTAKWLQISPGSPYANMARGNFLAASAWDARGSKYAAETPRDSIRRMSELAGQAIPYFEKALSLNPRLMPAYTGLIDMATADSRDDVLSDAFERARKVDPACLQLAKVRMISLEPRWGGDYESMLSYANELKQYMPGRPQLAIYVEAPFADRGDRLIAGDRYTDETIGVLDAAVAIGSDEDALYDAADAAINSTDARPDPWKGAVYLLQESRFKEVNDWASRNIAWMLVSMEPEWSLRYAQHAVALKPGNAWGHYLAGAAYYNTRQYPQADREYAVAMEDPDQRHASLREVAEMWLFSGFPGDDSARKSGALKAKPYIDQLLADYPDDGRGWIMKFIEGMTVGRFVDEAAIRATLGKADRSDPWQADKAKRLEAMLAKVKKPGK